MEPQLLNKLSRFLNAIDTEALSKEDFENGFKKVLDIVEQILKRQQEHNMLLEQKYEQLLKVLAQKTDATISDLKNKTNELFVGERIGAISKDQKSAFNSYRNELNFLIDKKLKDLDAEVKLKAVKGDKGDEGKHGHTPTREELDLILAPILEELRKETQRLRDARSNKSMGRAKIQILRAVDLTSQVDGSANAFTLPPDTVSVLGVYGTQFPITFRQNVDWVFSGRTLTLETNEVPIPQRGQTLWALCETLFYP